MIAKRSYSFFSKARRYRFRTVLLIALIWTLIDLVTVSIGNLSHLKEPLNSIYTREAFVFVMSLLMGYLFVFTLRRLFPNFPSGINFLFKTVVLLVAAFAMNFVIHFVENVFIHHESIVGAVHKFFYDTITVNWLIAKTFYWIVIFIITQLYIEINEKYSPGVFIDIIMGKYSTPKVENRIVMFIDLKDSTPIAEKMGHQQYFLFIREFIHDTSMALIEFNGRIYQYVGDEVVVSWPNSERNVRNALRAVIECRKNIQKKSEFYRRRFNIVPEFRVGIHVGDVTVGEIGIIKKDLAMSGDTMNTTARIRSACNELNKHFIVSAAFVNLSNLEEFQRESLGNIDLKGKSADVELYSLRI